MSETNDKPIEESKVELDGRAVTQTELQEQKQSTPAGKKIVETSPGTFKTLTRMKG